MLKLHPVPGKAKSKMLCEAFAAGAPKDAVGNVFFGVKAGNFAAWQRALSAAERGTPFYFIDNSYFDPTRGTHFRVTRNGLQHTGLDETDGTRFAATGLRIMPWETWKGLPVLVVQQSDDHMRYTVGEPNWLAKETLRILDNGATTKLREWSANKPEAQKTLAEALRECSGVLTHTSAAAVMAILAGVPVRCSPKCAAFGETGAGYEQRKRWAGVLADNQFTLDEMKDGTAWRKLQT